jgi:hypothetical protein
MAADVLIEALYGSEHLNISTSGSNKVHDNASTGMTRGNGRGDTGESRRQLGSDRT